jgi:hypothetical protein
MITMRRYNVACYAAAAAAAMALVAGCTATAPQPPPAAPPPSRPAATATVGPALTAPVDAVHAMQALIARAGAKLTASGLDWQGAAYAMGEFPAQPGDSGPGAAHQLATVRLGQPSGKDMADYAAGNPGYAMVQGPTWWMGIVAIAALPFDPSPAVIAARTGGEIVSR